MSPDEIAGTLIEVYERRGAGRYDEAVTQNEHACQCGAHAMAAGAADATVVAAFLHDIGHLLPNDAQRDSGDRRHEDVGSQYLTQWFDDDVTEPIRLHVPAKRYLCTVDNTYTSGLSAGSQRSLQLQGAAMPVADTGEFIDQPYAPVAVDLRRWDDLAKDTSAASPDLDVFRRLIVQVLADHLRM